MRAWVTMTTSIRSGRRMSLVAQPPRSLHRRIPLRVVAFALLLIVVSACTVATDTAPGSVRAAAAQRPGNVRAAAGVELANPYRGSYRWQSATPSPAGWPVKDTYLRLKWRDLEPREGHYDFSAIDRGLAQARGAGGVFGFRIQAACTGCATGGIAVPDYLVNLMPK